MDRCQVCNGAQKIRLPLYKPVTISFEATAEKLEDNSRLYQCPECAPTVAKDRVRVLEHHFQADTRFEGQQGYRELIVRRAVIAIAAGIEEGGFMRMQKGQPDRGELKQPYRITVGVVSAHETADIDAEAKRREDDFAQQVIAIATADINNWGSYYGHSEILKRDATHILSEALKSAQNRRPQ